MNVGAWRKHKTETILISLLFIFTLASVFFYESFKAEKAKLSLSEIHVKREMQREREHAAIAGQAEKLGEQGAILRRPFDGAKEAFDALNTAFRQTGLRHSQFRQAGDTDEGVRFEVAGIDSYQALLSFLDYFTAARYPAKITAASIEGASGENVSYRLTLDFLVKAGGPQ